MKKLTRDEIQSLSDYELNLWLYYCFKPSWFAGFSLEATIAAYNLVPVDYCNSLDSQFELAEKFGILYSVSYSPNPKEDWDADDKYLFGAIENYDGNGKTKRTGAELLLEAIQELEAVK